MEWIVTASMVVALLEQLIPIIEREINSGERTIEEQAALRARVDALRDRIRAAMQSPAGTFDGPEWKVSTDA